MNLTKIMFRNNLNKLCLEILGLVWQTFTLLIQQYIDGYFRLLPRSTLNIQLARFLKQFYEIVSSPTGRPDAPEGILHADEQCC